MSTFNFNQFSPSGESALRADIGMRINKAVESRLLEQSTGEAFRRHIDGIQGIAALREESVGFDRAIAGSRIARAEMRSWVSSQDCERTRNALNRATSSEAIRDVMRGFSILCTIGKGEKAKGELPKSAKAKPDTDIARALEKAEAALANQ